MCVCMCVCVCVCVCARTVHSAAQVVEGLQAAGVGGPVFEEYTRAVRRVKGAARLLSGLPHLGAVPEVGNQ